MKHQLFQAGPTVPGLPATLVSTTASVQGRIGAHPGLHSLKGEC